MPTPSSTPVSDGHSLEFRGFRFELSTEEVKGGYRPVVVLVRGLGDEPGTRLPADTEEVVYGTQEEAIRHAEQQATRLVNDRTGMGHVQV